MLQVILYISRELHLVFLLIVDCNYKEHNASVLYSRNAVGILTPLLCLTQQYIWKLHLDAEVFWKIVWLCSSFDESQALNCIMAPIRQWPVLLKC